MYFNLKLRLWTTGLRQHQLAQLVGIDETLMSKIINGHRKPDPKLRAAVARVLNSDEEWLFEVTARAVIGGDAFRVAVPAEGGAAIDQDSLQAESQM